MAFVDGWKTRYECKLCGAGLNHILQKSRDQLQCGFAHKTEVLLINGYPSPCPNSGKLLDHDEINEVNEPNIISYPNTMAY